MIRTALALFLVGLLPASAEASAFEPKTMQDTFPVREVERPLTMPKGWLQLSLGTDVKSASGYWNSAGEPVDFANAHWMWSTQTLGVRYGLAHRSELFWNLRTHYARLTNDVLGTDTAAFGLGDPSFGYQLELLSREAPRASLAAWAEYKAPAANESPGNYVGGANSFSTIVMTTGTPDLSVGLRSKNQFGPVALTLGIAGVHRFSNVVQYLVETSQNQFNGRIKPGDIVKADGTLTAQLGPVALKGTAVLQTRGLTYVGVTSEGLTGDRNLTPVAGSDGVSLDVTPAAVLTLGRSLDLNFSVNVPIIGEDFQFFPIEDLEPTRGATYSGSVAFRY